MPSLRSPGRVLVSAGLAAACLTAGYGLGLRDSLGVHQPSQPTMSAADQRAFGVVWETLGELERDYYQRDKLDPDKLAAGAARGMVQAVGDPYTTLSGAEQSDLVAAQLRGSFDGIGVELDRRDDQLTVVAPLAGSPAERAGVRAQDVIMAVDGQSVSTLGAEAVSARIRGQSGTTVALSLVRDGAPLDVSVVRASIRIESVKSRLLSTEPLLAYLRISTFSEPTAQQLRDQLSGLLAHGARGVVLDLRGNPGGYLTSAVDVASAFYKDGVVLYSQRGTGSSDAAPARRAYRTSGAPLAPDLPLAVLVDGGSASAAEIVAGALRDNQRGVLIGQTTFGKGTVQEMRTLSDDSRLRLTVAQWLTPSGHALQGAGLVPDVEVAPVDGSDTPLDAATQYLLGEIAHA